MRRIMIGLITVAIGSAGTVVLVATFGHASPNTLWFEIFKTLLQVGLVSATGAALSILTYDYQRRAHKAEKDLEQERIRDESRNAWLQGVLARAGRRYADVKRARRLLRGGSISKDEHGGANVNMTAYEDQILAINDAQLEFETLADDMRSSQAYAEVSHALADHFDRIEDALNLLITEYEEKRGQFHGDPPVLDLGQLPVLGEFIRRSKPARTPQSTELGYSPVHSSFFQVQHLIWRELLQSGAAKSGHRK